jgi:hypothetical protein
LSGGAKKLVNSSTINYGRLYTVETNVKVRDVGDLDIDSRRVLIRNLMGLVIYRQLFLKSFPPG